MATQMRSPLKDKPLPNPGDSIDRMIIDKALDNALFPMTAAMFFVLFTVLEWVAYLRESPRNPLTLTALALALAGWATYKFFKTKREVKHLKQGRDGERAVGQFLERLRGEGAQVFHDIPGEGFNLDHVVIHGSGIYVVETKTYSKPEKGEARILYNGTGISLLGKPNDHRPVTQVTAGASWLTQLLHESTGKKPHCRPILTFPGWYVENTAEVRSSDVWVLNPKGIPAFIGHSKPTLSKEDVSLYAYHLSRYLRKRV